jgi:hypothetical protein
MNCSFALLPMLLWFGTVVSVQNQAVAAQSSTVTSGAQANTQQIPGQPASPLPAPMPDVTRQPEDLKNPVPKMPSPEKSETNGAGAEIPPAQQQFLQPKTDILDSSATSAAVATDGHDPILDPPPFPKGATTLVGGIISSVDRIRNHLTVSIFGDGGNWTVYFDERTHIFRNGAEVSPTALKKGERVYVDTMLDNNKHDIFARNIRLGLVTPPAEASGQIVEVDAGHTELTLRDNINSTSVRFGVDGNTRISHGSQPAAFKDLVEGALVRVQFAADRSNRGLAREIVILATPGAMFDFAGTITYIDAHRNLLSVHNVADDKNYDIYFVPSRNDAAGGLAVGAEVRIRAMFEGTQYTAQQITVVSTGTNHH